MGKIGKREMVFDGISYAVYREEDEFEQAIEAAKTQENVLVARRCPKCGDYLFGRIAKKDEVPYKLEGTPQAPVCEEGFCGNRPGVFV